MPISHEFDAARSLVVYRGSGVLTPQEAMNVIDRVVTETSGKAMSMDVLFMLDPHASLSQIDMEAMQRIKAHLEGLNRKYPHRHIKCAIVSVPPEDAVGELWGAIVDLDGVGIEETRIFATAAEAYAWLQPLA